jgi:hypothetical protein
MTDTLLKPFKRPPKPPCVIGAAFADAPDRRGAALVLSCLLGPVVGLSKLLTDASRIMVTNV